jgi:transposase
MSIKKETYLGYNLHLLCNSDGYPYDFLITPANIDDRVPVIEFLESQNQLMEYLLADKGYTGVDFRRNIEEKIGITIYPLPKKGDFQPKCEESLRRLVFKKRRRIETTGSQLTDQLNMQRVRSKFLWGLMTRLFSKFLAFDVAYIVNLLNGSKHPIKIKSLIF